ncbi:ERO1-like protein beta isoform X2 [Dreissena polymorpha]|uniref:ERO1-like protein beta isoform X2 n=1 Tax=Dreissena polymorpha TaxID=45954 RepID=UPI002264AF7B|nr:ERO1-like protein beta isoform X2 [Dreissena polymorpha]
MNYSKYFNVFVIFGLIVSIDSVKNKSKKNIGSSATSSTSQSPGCFCKLFGEVDDCTCKIDSLESLNNLQVYPRLDSLLARNFFRYVKVNLMKECPFWADDSKCAMKNCAVKTCTAEQLPYGLKNADGECNKYAKEAQPESPRTAPPGEKDEDCSEPRGDLGYLNTTISKESEEAFKDWTKYDDAQETFCELDDDTSPNMQYVDLLLNPERYTGYKGESPHRIWNSIYKENCFKPAEQSGYNSQSLTDLCLEKRVFYRMISGLHASINIHLSHQYLFPASTCYGIETWGPNNDEFQSRFDHEKTDGRGPQWLKNLYFTYLVELRALEKAAPYLEQEDYFTGDDEEDVSLKKGIKDLLRVIKEFPNHFDESRLFRGNKKEAKALKQEFREHFRNISRIMDCVGCDKCKLWGKIQVQGMGTALKILFSGDGMGPQSTVSAGSKRKFQLRRTEIVSLFNAFGRLSSSIHAVEEFRRRLS